MNRCEGNKVVRIGRTRTRHGTIDARDIELIHRTDSVDEAYDWIVPQLAEKALEQPGAIL